MTKPIQHLKATSLAAALCVAGLTAACGGGSDSSKSDSNTAGAGVYDSQLAFDKTKYTTITVTLDGVSTPVRW